MKVIDTPYSVFGKTHRLKGAGIGAVVRYISSNSETFPNKRVTAEEIAELHSVGIAVGFVWETTGSIDVFSADNGTSHATEALAVLAAFKAPPTVAPYFAVDLDVIPGQSIFVRQYAFKAKEACALHGRKIGVYGSGYICGLLKGLTLAQYTWLAQSRGWNGYGNWSQKADLVQGPSATIAGISCDTGSLQVLPSAAGFWLP